jgi:hypothetical protein
MCDGVGFWTIVFVVFLALVAHDFLRLAVVAMIARMVVEVLQEECRSMLSAVFRRNTPVPAPVELPVWPGPLTAYRQGSSRACIDGRVANRLENGWSQQHDQRCSASSF